MHNDSNSTDRKPGDYVLFAIAFLGLVVAGVGVIVSSAPLALSGATILLLSLVCFLPRPPMES